MPTVDCTTDSSYVRMSDTCLLRVSKDAPKLPGCAVVPDMRFTVLKRAKVRTSFDSARVYEAPAHDASCQRASHAEKLGKLD